MTEKILMDAAGAYRKVATLVRKSGLSEREYCYMRGVSSTTLSKWKGKDGGDFSGITYQRLVGPPKRKLIGV